MANSKLIFDPASGIVSPDTSEIRESVATDWKAAFTRDGEPELDTDIVTPAGQLIDSEVAEIESKNAAIQYLANQFNPRVNEGMWQDAIGYVYFLERKIAEPTIVTCQISGSLGTVIPYGAIAKSTDGYELICNRSVTIDDTRQAETTFRVSSFGAIEIAAHSVTTIVTVTPGWDTIDNAAAGAVGRIEETRSEFETRRYASVAANSHGSTSALYGTLANLTGVLDVQVLENIGPYPVIKYGVEVPGHGVTICIYGGEDDDIAEIIYKKKDNGCDTGGNTDIIYQAADYHNAIYEYKILRPTTVNFWVKITLGDGSTPSAKSITALKDAIVRNFYGGGNFPRAGLAQDVYASRFYCSALQIDEIHDIRSIEIALSNNEPTGYFDVVTIRGDQEPVMSSDNVIVG